MAEDLATTTVWEGAGDSAGGEAILVGDLWGPPRALDGVAQDEDGRTGSFRLYTGSPPLDEVPESSSISGIDFDIDWEDLTPYEAAVLEAAQRPRSLRDLADDLALTPVEVDVTLLTLQERGLVDLDLELPTPSPTPSAAGAPSASGSPSQPVPLPGHPAPRKPPPLPFDALLPAEPSRPGGPPEQGSEAEPLPPKPPSVAQPPRGGGSPAESVTVRRASASARPGVSVHPPSPAAASQAAQGPQSPDGSRASEFEPAGEAPNSERVRKAQRLYQAALRDRESGNDLSARMNAKLALAFEPDRATFQQLFRSLSESRPSSEGPRIRNVAVRTLFDKAQVEEEAGRLDAAISMLQRALRVERHPVILNRLGVLLAAHRKDFPSAEALLEEAVERAPENPAYVHNLSKVLSTAAVAERSPTRKGTFWQRIRRLLRAGGSES